MSENVSSFARAEYVTSGVLGARSITSNVLRCGRLAAHERS